MAIGLTCDEATDRLNIFQSKFDNIYMQFNDLILAEELFHRKKSSPSELNAIKIELDMMQVH